MTTLAVTSVNSLFCQASTCLRIGSNFSLHSINTNRKAVDERERLRIFRQDRREHACNNLSPSSACPEVPGSAWSKSHSEDSRSRGDAMPRLTKRQDGRLQCETDTRELRPSKLKLELIARSRFSTCKSVHSCRRLLKFYMRWAWKTPLPV